MKKQPKSRLLRWSLSLWLALLALQLSCNLPALRQPLQSIQRVIPLASPTPQPMDQLILQQADVEHWLTWVEELSGEKPIVLNGEEHYLRSRFSYAMFLDYPQAQVMPYLVSRIQQWVPADQIEIDPYEYNDAERSYTWQNLIVRLPGKTQPEQKILLTAHIDSIVVREGNALELAPGADDNASGAAVLLEALRIFSQRSFDKTIEIVFFSGEEEGLKGSMAYLQDHPHDGIQAVINVDMIGYDANQDGCFEIHAGNQSASQTIAELIQQTVAEYSLNLQPEILTADATDRSDHGSFWAYTIPAVTVSENFFERSGGGTCAQSDPNPYYHRNQDVTANLNVSYGHQITQAVLLSLAQLAGPGVNPLP